MAFISNVIRNAVEFYKTKVLLRRGDFKNVFPLWKVFKIKEIKYIGVMTFCNSPRVPKDKIPPKLRQLFPISPSRFHIKFIPLPISPSRLRSLKANCLLLLIL